MLAWHLWFGIYKIKKNLFFFCFFCLVYNQLHVDLARFNDVTVKRIFFCWWTFKKKQPIRAFRWLVRCMSYDFFTVNTVFFSCSRWFQKLRLLSWKIFQCYFGIGRHLFFTQMIIKPNVKQKKKIINFFSKKAVRCTRDRPSTLIPRWIRQNDKNTKQNKTPKKMSFFFSFFFFKKCCCCLLLSVPCDFNKLSLPNAFI